MKIMLVEAPRPMALAIAARPSAELVYLHAAGDIKAITKAGHACQGFPFRSRAKIDLAAIRAARAAIQASRPDLIHAFYGRPLANIVLATMGMRCPPPIVSYRGIERVPSLLDPSELIAYWHRRVVAHACESDAVAAALSRGGIPRERCVTIYNCVPTALRPGDGRAALAPWNVPANAFVVGTVATMRPVKGIDLLLRAAIECVDLPDICWVLIGPVHDRRITDLARHPTIRDRVRLLGPQTTAASLAGGFDVFAMPSRSEALCRALLEAMSQRVCPVVSDAGGMKEVVRHGHDGLVAPRENVAALAAAIRQLYFDRQLCANLAASAAQRIQDEFTPQCMAARAMSLYERVLAGEMSTRRAA